MTDLARILERELAGACSLNALACRKWDAAETKLAAASQAYECAMAIHGTVMEERDRLATELAAAKAEASHYMAVAQKATDELIFFRADSLKAHQMTCAAALERDSLRAEVERLMPYVSKAILTHGGTILCSPQVGVAFNEMQARAERAEAALAFIAENGGTTHETECGTISCNGSWCAEQARAAMKGTP
jgi:hypothetical protein